MGTHFSCVDLCTQDFSASSTAFIGAVGNLTNKYK